MKPFFTLLFALILFSCSSDDDSGVEPITLSKPIFKVIENPDLSYNTLVVGLTIFNNSNNDIQGIEYRFHGHDSVLEGDIIEEGFPGDPVGYVSHFTEGDCANISANSSCSFEIEINTRKEVKGELKLVTLEYRLVPKS
ncbi:hypothetical protein [Aquimarina algiphila]|uniref:Uncharacterized protein n=1 Tax=Aquimarina algiphila TaxID=2047982 RepID=A0A554VE20_9FLAO|nr:hypothetical protein [Aquimarina algiphila]TSE05251.1 hypothetical protein FOF46_23595 [Aquimarina algiphila]